MKSQQNLGTPINVDFHTSTKLHKFLSSERIGLAISTYQSGNVFLVGPGDNGELRVRSVIVERPMGMCLADESLFIAGLSQLHRFNNVVPPRTRYEGSDKVYVPHVSWLTGELDCHDVGVERDGRVVFVNSLHSCLATISDTESFVPLWRPPCVSALAPEDRCHLNGLALRDGVVRYATAFSKSDAKQGWRGDLAEKGVVWDVRSNSVAATGLTMPHSPRWEFNRLWVLNSGSGELLSVEMERGGMLRHISLPGYLRGLSFYKHFAVVGSSIPREGTPLSSVPITPSRAQEMEPAYCGIFFVNMNTWTVEHFIKITGDIQEIYDVLVIPGVDSPDGVGMFDERRRYILKIGSPIQQ